MVGLCQSIFYKSSRNLNRSDDKSQTQDYSKDTIATA